MGAGKSTVARILGSRLGWRVEDIDTLIEAREHRRVAEIFARDGEAHFRQIEREVLHEVFRERHSIVATGGGTFVDPDNRNLINRDGVSIWLDISFAQVVERLPSDGYRPLASHRTTMQALFETRRTAYVHAHLRLEASRSPVGELVERIMEWLDS